MPDVLPRVRAAGYYIGMFTAFAHFADGRSEALESLEGVSAALTTEGTALWIDLESPEEEELREVGRRLSLSSEALDDCLRGEQRSRIDEFSDHIFFVLYGMLGADESEGFAPRKLAGFCGSRFLVTVHADALQTIRVVRDRCARHPSQTIARGPDLVLYSIMDGMVDRYAIVADAYDARIEQMEEASLDAGVGETILADVSDMRRSLLELRRLASAQRELLAPVARGDYDYISSNLEQRFGHVHDHLTETVEQIDGLREHLRAVRENYHTALTSRMNETMKTLTIFAAILLPLSLVAGIYGMNVALWPGPTHPQGFLGVLGAMAIIAGATLYYFRRRRWL